MSQETIGTWEVYAQGEIRVCPSPEQIATAIELAHSDGVKDPDPEQVAMYVVEQALQDAGFGDFETLDATPVWDDLSREPPERS